MTRRDRQRLADIETAIMVIRRHLARGDLSDGLIFDAVRVRLIEIGEAVKSLPRELLAREPSIQHDLPELEAAVSNLVQQSQEN